MLIGSRQLVEQRRLSAVLIPRKRKRELCSLRQRMLRRGIMEFSAFTESGMAVLPKSCVFWGLFAQDPGHLLLFAQRHLDLLCIIDPQSQVIPMDAQLHRVTHRCIFDHFHDRSGNHPHIQKMLAQSALSSDFRHNTGLSDIHIFDRH